MAMVAVAGDDLVAGLDRHLHADDDRLLADIEVAEAADQPHAVELAGLLLEPADEQHVAIGAKLLLLAEIRHLRRMLGWTLGARRRAGPLVCCWQRPFFSSGVGDTSVRRPPPQ